MRRLALLSFAAVVACGGPPTGLPSIEPCTLARARIIGQVCELDPYVREDGTLGYRITLIHCEPLRRWARCPDVTVEVR